MAVEIGVTSGKYIGNGTSQQILFSTSWRQLTIISADRKYIMYYMKDNGITLGQGAIGSGGTYKQLEAVAGGVSTIDGGFEVGDHISVNGSGTTYYWSVS